MSTLTAPATNDLRFNKPAVEYLAMQAPVTDPENHEQDVIAKAVRAARLAGNGVVRLPLGADLNLFTSVVMDAEMNADRHSQDRETFTPVERDNAYVAVLALAAYTA